MRTKVAKKIVKLELPDDLLRATRIFCATAGISRSLLVEKLWRGYLDGSITLSDQPKTEQPVTEQPIAAKLEV